MTGTVLSIPYLDLAATVGELEDELGDAARRVIASGRYILGPELERFEADFAAYCGTRHAVGVANGLEALSLSLRAWNIGPGDEVVVPAFTFVATWLAVASVGAAVVPVDVDEESCNLTVDAVAAALTPRTRAIVPVHLYGRPADPDGLMALAEEHGVRVLADAAQAHGATSGGRPVGGLAHASAFSFYPVKNLGALGDGGAVVTSDGALADELRRLRNYGSSRKYEHDVAGVNSRLDELQAALLSVKLPRLDGWVARRRALAQRYREGLRDVASLRLPGRDAAAGHAHHVFPVMHSERDALQEHLAQRGVGTLIHYPCPPHRTGAFAGLELDPDAFPVSDALSRTELSLPLHEHLGTADVDAVVEAIRAF